MKNEKGYDIVDYCPVCGGANELRGKDVQEGGLHEAVTVCMSCGHEGYWAYGFFMPEDGEG